MYMPVVIPAYMPDENMTVLIRELLSRCKGLPIIIINDGSPAGYDSVFEATAALSSSVIVLKHQNNMGKGAALKTAFKYIMDKLPEAKGCVTADCDGQHSPKDIERVYRTLEENPDSLVLGARDFSGDDVPEKSLSGNRMASKLFKRTTGRTFEDTQTGLRGIPASLFERCLNLKGKRYEFEMRMLIDAVNADCPIIEIPIECIYESKSDHKTHYRPIRDSLRIGVVFFGKFFAFVFSSLFSATLDIVLFWLFSLIFERVIGSVWYVTLAVVCARGISATENYIVNRVIVFESKTGKASSIIKYIIVAVCQMGLNAFITTGLVALFPFVLPIIWKIVTNTLLFILSYWFQKNFVFREKK